MSAAEHELSTQERLVLEVLDARHQLGEAAWPFGPEYADILTPLQARGLVAVERGTGGTLLAWRPAPQAAAAADELPRNRQRPVADLRRAMDAREIVLHYQPQVDISTGRVIAVEALARWEHPGLGLLSPAVFLPAAERGGLMRELTLHVLNEALTQVAAWQVSGSNLRVAVNLSASDIRDPGLVEDVAAAIARNGVSRRAIDLEITETTAMADPERSIDVLTRLDGMGVDVSVDDYGTGHSSLAYLHRLPVRKLKIDRSFVAGLLDDYANIVIVRSTLTLARQLGLLVVAEGVEDDNILRTLRDMRCDAAQGYGIGRPVPADHLRDEIARIETRLPRVLQSRAGCDAA